jgi:hypothetical protein
MSHFPKEIKYVTKYKLMNNVGHNIPCQLQIFVHIIMDSHFVT